MVAIGCNRKEIKMTKFIQGVLFLEECNNCQQKWNLKVECTKIALKQKKKRKINKQYKIEAHWIMTLILKQAYCKAFFLLTFWQFFYEKTKGWWRGLAIIIINFKANMLVQLGWDPQSSSLQLLPMLYLFNV